MLLVPGFHMADTTRGGRVYLAADGGICVLFDTGAPDGTLGASELVQSAGRRPEDVRLLVLTHAHPGHSGNAAGLRVLTAAPLAASAAAAEALRTPQEERRHGLSSRLRRAEVVAPVPVQRVLEPGERIDLCGGIEVIAAPGHGGGSLAFHLPVIGVVVVGDAATVTAEGLRPPPARVCEDAAAAEATVARLAQIDARCLAPGHGFPLVDGRLPGRRSV